MGINYNYSKDDSEETTKIKEESLNIKGPEFYLNKEFPNYYNISLEEVLQNLLKSKYDLLENKELTSSLSKQFKLLYQQKSEKSNNTKSINNNNINNTKEFSFSQIEFNEDKKSENNNMENNNDINIQNNKDENNDLLKLDLLNNINNSENNKKEKDNNNNNINNNEINYNKNPKLFMSDYIIFSSKKTSE